MEPVQKQERNINQIVKNKTETMLPSLIRKEFCRKNLKHWVIKVGYDFPQETNVDLMSERKSFQWKEPTSIQQAHCSLFR